MKLSAVDISQLLVEEGVVVEVESDGIWVETEKTSVCGACAARNGCGQGLLARVGGSDMMRIKVSVDASYVDNIRLGQLVKIGVDPSALAASSLVLYLCPLVFMVFAGILGASLGQPEWIIVLLSFGGFISGSYLSSVYSKMRREDQRFHPVLVDF